jgi:uncharacterized NAD-dependent epimerase/dehydratase family protein
MVGTGQTAWMQGARFGFVCDSIISDFVAGEFEHAAWSAWDHSRPDVIVLEGQGSLLNPAYPGGFELIAAGRPDVIVLQHAPARVDYDGFPGYRIQPLPKQIRARVESTCETIARTVGLPTFDVLLHGAGGLCDVIERHLAETKP